MVDESTIPAVFRQKLPPNLEKIKRGTYTRNDPDYSVNLYLKEHDIRVNEKGSEIVEFLRGKNVLVTGATGFLGKLLVEKLLRSCKDIGKIYIIVRTKKGKDPQTRVNEYLNSWVFLKLAQIHPNFREKIVGFSGDLEFDALGLSEETQNIIKDQVNIIYHVAATVRFDEKLKTAVKLNIRGTQEVINIAKGCKKLDVFVHFSTAYANCHEKVIKEEFYPPHLDPYKMMRVAAELPNDVLENIAPKLIGSKAPNTYAFTKQITEDIVRREAIGLPVCIHRPSIVIASAKEPVRSWVDNIFGPVGLIQGAAMGLLHTMIAKPNSVCDMVPADFVINSLIVASYKTAKERQLDKIPIYNYISSNDNPLRWRDLALAAEQGKKVGCGKVIMHPFFRYLPFRSVPVFWLLTFLLHTVPGYILDFFAVQFGHKPQLKGAYTKIGIFLDLLTYFTLNEWKFENRNTTKSWNELNDVDKLNFPFDMKSLDWLDYFDTYLVAMREFLMKDFLDTLDEGRQHMKRLAIIHYILVSTITALSAYFLLNTIFFFVPVTIILIVLFYALTPEK